MQLLRLKQHGLTLHGEDTLVNGLRLWKIIMIPLLNFRISGVFKQSLRNGSWLKSGQLKANFG